MTKQPPAQKHLEEKDRAAFESWFLKHFANGKGTFFYSMKESFQFALEYARQEISPDINELVISNDITAPTSEGLAVTSSKSHTVTSSKTEPAVLVLPKDEELLDKHFPKKYWGGESRDVTRMAFKSYCEAIRRLNPSLKVSVGDE